MSPSEIDFILIIFVISQVKTIVDVLASVSKTIFRKTSK